MQGESTRDAIKDARRVLMIYTGGTIGMTQGPSGYRPEAGFLARAIRSLPAFQDPSMPAGVTPPSRLGGRIRYELIEYDPLLDSSNMGMDDWVRIAHDIERHYDDFDAFIVLHGTDTMAYTASALSFMLENLGKTVIVTGSQIPLCEVRNDGEDNLLDALILAGHYDIPEVCLYFRSHLFRGNRTRKVDASALAAFDSQNFPPLATVGIDVDIAWERVLAPTGERFRVREINNPNVAVLRLFPGISSHVLENLLSPPLQGVVLETYGAGNAPDNRADFLEALRRAHERGVVLVNATQCGRGSVAAHYAAGAALADAGVVGGADMTTEAALTKLAYLLSLGLERDEVRRLLASNLRGELTSRAEVRRFSFREKAFVQSVAQAVEATSERDRGVVADALYPVLMCSAAGNGDVDGVRRMLDGGADVNGADYDRRTPLHLAAAEGHVDVVGLLLERGAEVDRADRWGATPLRDAVSGAHDEVAALLRDRGARLDPARVVDTLCVAAAKGALTVVHRLLVSGADPTLGDYDGRTPLHLAASEGHLEVARALLLGGASPRARDRWQSTPLDDAIRHERPELVALLSE